MVDIRCECIDEKTITDLKLALITARDTYQGVANSLKKSSPSQTKTLEDKARDFHILINHVDRIRRC